jgi:NAD(P)-dependent dehydrogenase (short-subunit alcohol dehydrogenase family)
MELREQVAIVTGGASGIGAAVVARLRAAGARPVVWDVAPDAEVTCDVSDEKAVEQAMARTLASAGAPSVLVCCAGVGSFRPLVEMTVDEWDRVLGINLRGTMLCIRAAAREMLRAARPGAMVCISSISAQVVDPGMSAYCASKAGVEVLARSAARELGEHGIRVCCVAPGATATPLLAPALALPAFQERLRDVTPLGRVGTPDDVAGAVMALLAADWVTGVSLAADGGLLLQSAADLSRLRAPR